MKYQYHHMGIPADTPRPGERYSSAFKMYTADGDDPHFRIQWHRFEPDCPLHPLIKTMTHVAFKVNNLERAVAGRKQLLEPYEPLLGFRAAMVEVDGAPIELIETSLTDDEIWDRAGKKSLLYPDGELL